VKAQVRSGTGLRWHIEVWESVPFGLEHLLYTAWPHQNSEQFHIFVIFSY
jgi:hypothetical protein